MLRAGADLNRRAGWSPRFPTIENTVSALHLVSVPAAAQRF